MKDSVESVGFEELAADGVVETWRSAVMTPARFVAGARAVDWRRACAEYLAAFPCAKFPKRVSPWWVMTAEAVRARIALGKPYTAADEPKVGKRGKCLTAGTDGA